MRRLLLVTLMLALAASFGTLACGDSTATGGSGGKGGTGGTGGTAGTGGTEDGGTGGGGSGGDPDIGVRPCGRYSNKIHLDADLKNAAILPKPGENPELLPPPADAGKAFADPFFGTVFVRLTSLTQGGQSCTTPTYGQNAISLDRKHVMVWCKVETETSPRLLEIDPDKLKVLANSALFTVQASNDFYPEAEDARFSGTDPDLMFLRQIPDGNPQAHNRVWRYSMSSRFPTLKKSFDNDVDPKTERIEQLSMSDDDKVIAVARVDRTSNAILGYVVWSENAPTEVKSVAVDKLERVRIDRSGRYLFLTVKVSQPSQPSVQVVDLESGGTTNLRAADPEEAAPDWFDLGAAMELGYGKFSNDIRMRDLATPDASTVLIPHETFGVLHPPVINFSLANTAVTADHTGWAMVAFQGAPNTPYGNELDLLTVDGSRPNPDGFQKVYRLAHHRADSDPHASLSPDGCLIAFTSRFTPVEQEHVYLLVVPKL